jgi:hypothetical protein
MATYARLNIYKVFGTISVAAGLCVNEWTIKLLSHGETRFAEIEQRVFLIFSELILIYVGMVIVKYEKKAVQRLSLVIVSLVLFSITLEVILTLFFENSIHEDSPIWIPPKFVSLNEEVNLAHTKRSTLNEFGFNDINRALENRSVNKRITILGDSFIWGDGVEDSVRWCDKLEGLFNRDHKNVEILKWGKRGWSTVDEYNFYSSFGSTYSINLLIVGFVVNDPVMDSSMQKVFIRKNGFVYRTFFKPIGMLFPNSLSLFVDLVNNFSSTYCGYGYYNWINQIYTRQNLEKYQLLLNSFSTFCKQRKMGLLFVLTPENHNRMLGEKFDEITPLLEKADIEYLNLYPVVEQELHNYSNRELWANPANGHPGNLVTTVYAKNVYAYLMQSNYGKNH